MNPLQLRQTIDHHLNQLSLTHLQTVAQMVTYLAAQGGSRMPEWSAIIQDFESPDFVPMEELTWEQLRNTMSPFAPSQFESPETPSVYQGKPLSLEEMDLAIQTEVGKRQ